VVLVADDTDALLVGAALDLDRRVLALLDGVHRALDRPVLAAVVADLELLRDRAGGEERAADRHRRRNQCLRTPHALHSLPLTAGRLPRRRPDSIGRLPE